MWASPNIKKDTSSYTDLVDKMLESHTPFPVHVFHDPRFSRKEFKKKWNIAIEECLWNLNFILKNQDRDIYLVKSRYRTDKQFTDLLDACHLNKKYVPVKIFTKKVQYLLSSIKSELDIKKELPEKKLRKKEKFFQKELKKIPCFLSIWNQLFQHIMNENNQNLINFYHRPKILAILINLLYDNLNSKKISLKDIPYTFIIHTHTIAKPLYILSDNNVSEDMQFLKKTLEKNIMYSHYILLTSLPTISIVKKIQLFLYSFLNVSPLYHIKSGIEWCLKKLAL